MSINLCLQNIVGITRKEDSCIDGYDASYSVSDSGLFMDEIPGMNLRVIDSLGGATDIWEKMIKARENAINTFKTDIWGEILKFNEYRREKFVGEIGYRRFSQVISKDTYHGMRLFSDIRGGVFTLRGVTLGLNTNETVDLLIYDDFELLYTIQIDSVANKPNYNAVTPIDLDLNGNYYFIYAPVGIPYNNKMTCGCGGFKWCFDIDHPCFKGSRDNWTMWAMAGGIHGDDPADRDDWGVSFYAQGLRLHGEFKCDATDILCSESSDFVTNEVDRAMAFAIAYKADEYLSYEIMNSNEVSRYTLLGKDSLIDNMKYYSDRYTAMINYIAENIESSRSDCLRCRPALGISKTSQHL